MSRSFKVINANITSLYIYQCIIKVTVKVSVWYGQMLGLNEANHLAAVNDGDLRNPYSRKAV